MRRQALDLPPVDPRILPLAKQWTAGALGDDERAAQIERHLRTEFAYTSTLLDRPVADPLAHFLFERQAGHCEYFASAMTVMLRTLQIPARLATGFQSGAYNPISGWYLVRGADAHTWVEAYVEGRGWVAYDPTPEDARRRGGLWGRIPFYLDTAGVFWQEWVMSYDLERQLLLAGRLGRGGRGVRFEWERRWTATVAQWRRGGSEFVWSAARLAAVLAAAVTLVWILPHLARRRRQRQKDEQLRRGEAAASDATALYERMLALLGHRHIEKPGWMTPNEFAATITDPRLAPVVGELTGAYHGLRFGRRAALASRIIGLLEQLAAEVRR